MTGVLLATSVAVFAGVYRHDVAAKKYRALAAQQQFDCVGRVMTGREKHRGTCVLISDRYVLTAAHLFIESDVRNDTMYLAKDGRRTDTLEKGGSTLISYVPVNKRVGDAKNYSVLINGKYYQARWVIIYPTYLDSMASKTGNVYGDLALVELNESVKDIAPAIMNKAYNELSATITGVGYGASGPADKPELVEGHKEKIAGQNVADTLLGPMINGRQSRIACDFDHATRTDCNMLGSAAPVPMEYVWAGGDSGGGVFMQAGGKWLLCGTITGASTDINQLLKTGYYGQQMQFTRLSVFADWIEREMK